MLGWFKRRIVYEHSKLLIQNRFACEVLGEGWFAKDDALSDWLARRKLIVSEIARHFDRKVGLPADIVQYQLQLNKELRRIHDCGPAIIGEKFDVAYEPLGGYKRAIESFLADE